MGFKINTNVGAMNAHNWGIRTNLNIDNSLQKLSSGLRINKAADDASGMAIADSLKSQAKGLEQSIANANDGIGVVQTADGALDEYLNILNTIKKKAVQAASDGQSLSTRKMIQTDINQLLEEAQNIAATTSFNGLSLLNGAFENKSFHIGAYSGETVKLSIGNTQIREVGKFAYASGTMAIEKVTGAAGTKTEALNLVVEQTINGDKVIVSASSQFLIQAGGTGATSLQRAQGLVDEFNEQANLKGASVRAAVTQVASGAQGGDKSKEYTIRLYSKDKFTVSTGDDKVGNLAKGGVASGGAAATDGVYHAALEGGNAKNNSLAAIDVTTREKAEKAIIIADFAIGEIDDTRSKIGSAQQKLESTIRNISVTRVNVAAAESNIRDVDFAAESANFNKQNILAQSGTYAMSQANAVQQNVLRLLQ